MTNPIDRDYARMMTELRALSQVWEPAPPRIRRKPSLLRRLTHRH
ncbi:MAG: hypothetical protein V9G19_15025 [Tetrasphaera sp.]